MTVTAAEQAVAAQFTGADPALVPAELKTIIEAAMVNSPRSLQRRIGPSELGVECVRCLAHKLGGTPDRPEAAWLPQVGTAVHEWLEGVFLRHEYTRADLGMPGRFLPETRVNVGTVGGVEITGSIDLFDTHSGVVCDWKVTGVTTLRSAKAKGPSLQYQRQAQLYAKGMEDAGYRVCSTLVYYLPRNSVILSDGYAWQAPYDRANAEATLTRADTLANLIHDVGLAEVLAGLPPHDDSGFSCRRMADYVRPEANPSAPFGAI